MLFSGKTVSGDGRGKKLGFPTLNISLANNKYPQGVFAVRGKLPQKSFNGIVHFGPRPTFAKTDIRIEIHLFHFTDDVEQNTHVEFQIVGEKIRDIQKFSSPQELQDQIQQDCTIARQILNLKMPTNEANEKK